MPAPLAYLITWTTYGTWLPGDERGWVESGKMGIRGPDASRKQHAVERMKSEPVSLCPDERQLVEETIRKHCEIRKWALHALNVRTNHVHLVITAPVIPEKVMSQFKAWCSRRLNENLQPARSASEDDLAQNGGRNMAAQNGLTMSLT
ncbi:MAG: transposase [Planctomycetes bacterium]|nr:transposase [Planctomycetota bacterium]